MSSVRHIAAITVVVACYAPAVAAQDHPDPDPPKPPVRVDEPAATAEPNQQATPDAPRPTVSAQEIEYVMPSQCSSTDVASAMEGAQASIAHVQGPGASGLGFVFHTRDHVVTALSIVERGRGIRVSFEGNDERPARIIAVDRSADLAILELDDAAPATPLQLAAARLGVGDPVLALGTTGDRWGQRKGHHHKLPTHWRHHHAHGWPGDAGGDKLIHPGTITSAKGERLRSDAVDSRNLTWGAPLLDCDGRVVGISTTPFSDEVISAERLRSLEAEIADDATYASGWSLGHGSIGLVGQLDHQQNEVFEEHDHWLGFSVGTALIGNDRWYFPVRFSATWLMGPDYEDANLERSGYRLGGHAAAGHRFMVKGGETPVYLAPTIGFGVWYEKLTLTTSQLFVESDCGAATCPVQSSVTESESDRWRPMPTAGFDIHIGVGQLGYQFQLDTREHEHSVHQLTLGAQW